MNYIVMLTTVLGLAFADFITGIIKAYVQNDLSSAKMRTGGLNKLCEIIVMAVACGMEIGVELLGTYYQAAKLTAMLGAVTAIAVFTYISVMELISILENYGAISPDAIWVRNLIRRLRKFRIELEHSQEHDDESDDKN